MGYTPRQIERMSLWQYEYCLQGWQRAHEGTPREKDDGMTPELFRKLMDAPVRDYGVH